jgi:ABC-2 type transport system permease protein
MAILHSFAVTGPFPMFFASSALYPLWRLKEASPILHGIAAINPFTHARLDVTALGWVVTALAVCLALALYRYEPSRPLRPRRFAP